MSTTIDTASHPFDLARRWPDGDDVQNVDWRERAGEDGDGWTSAECVDVESTDPGDGRTYYVVAQARYGTARRIRVDADDEGNDVEAGEWFTAGELAERIDDNEDEASAGAYVERLRMARAVLEACEDEGVESAEGPMMNFFYLLERGGALSRDVDIDVWAAELAHLPVCAVELDGDYGLALTGGGMDLSWEIAEAFLRLGYRVPQWLDLPAMADGGRIGRRHRDDDDAPPLTETDAAIVRAVIRTQRATAAIATRKADQLAERYGITETPED